MKILSNKKRKLAYIRQKNHYRLGGSSGSYIKISKELIEDVDYIISLSNIALNELSKKFKMDFELVKYNISASYYDLDRGLMTVIFTYKAVKP